MPEYDTFDDNAADAAKFIWTIESCNHQFEVILKLVLGESDALDKLFDPENGALKGLHSKLLLCEAMGLLKERETFRFKMLIKIRNLLAHDRVRSLTSPDVLALRERLDKSLDRSSNVRSFKETSPALTFYLFCIFETMTEIEVRNSRSVKP